MGRDKLKRTLHFKPKYNYFSSNESDNREVIELLHEEMEALYLMDTLELYQADAATKMGISRPTFAKIIKRARQKVTMMLVTGNALEIVEEKTDFLVMVPSDDKEQIINQNVVTKFLLIYHIENGKILKKGSLPNPIFRDKLRPAQILPQLCLQHHINFFMSYGIGMGLKSALLSKGVYPINEKSITIKRIKTLGQ